MALETVPLLLGAVVALLGLGLVADGSLRDSDVRVAERRRRARTDRSRPGEVLIGLGLLALAAALVGRDAWRWGTVAVLAGVALQLAGILLNGRFLRERVFHRGRARRGRGRERRGGRAERAVPLLVARDDARRGGDRREPGQSRRPTVSGVIPENPSGRGWSVSR